MTMSKKRTSKPSTPYLSYAEKLRDPRWQKMRLEVMQRDKFKCRVCDSTEKTLNVHHRFYRKGAAPWEYEPSTLVTLCEDCHAAAEAEKDFIQQACAGPSYRQTFIARLIAVQMATEDPRCPHLMAAMDQLAGFLSEWKECMENPHDMGETMAMLHSSYRGIVVQLGHCVESIERLYYGVDEV